MKVRRDTDVFNLMDTNGRRKDIINAYAIYLSILQKLFNGEDSSWERFPKSLNQYRFYREAITASPEAFKIHPKYDEFQRFLESHDDVKQAFFSKDFDKTVKLFDKYKGWNLNTKLDNPIEGRARHYTSNLVKVGFTDKKRQISPVGMAFLNGYDLHKDEFESILPIKDGNLIFLRQMMKLKIYTKKYDGSYSPMLMALYLLTNAKRISQMTLLNASVFLNPYLPIDPVKVLKAVESDDADLYTGYIDYAKTDGYDEINAVKGVLPKEIFDKYIRNQKNSKKYGKVYYDFYLAILKYQETGNIEPLFKLYSEFTSTIDSAFGFGGHVFKWPRGTKSVERFLKDNKNNSLLNAQNLNTNIYKRYLASTRMVSVMEYSDTFRRLLKASGIVSFKNGIAELMYKDLWENLFHQVDIRQLIFQKYSPTQAKDEKADDEGLGSMFRSNIPISQILKARNIDAVMDSIRAQLHISTSQEAKDQLLSQKDEDFKAFVQKSFPREKVYSILKLFDDRSNDIKIKQLTQSDASVPTIYEYIVGLAWYYISDEPYNLYNSFNLSMNADFRPETHAAGGEGDIVIKYSEDILMLEVTLMNKQAQKRGEWEPVLRHTANLTIDSTPTKVQTLFIADELDPNTINIWRAVASVPIRSSQSSKEELVANNVTIMPIKNDELGSFLKEDISSKALLDEVRQSFGKLKRDFDESWRTKILSKVVK